MQTSIPPQITSKSPILFHTHLYGLSRFLILLGLFLGSISGIGDRSIAQAAANSVAGVSHLHFYLKLLDNPSPVLIKLDGMLRLEELLKNSPLRPFPSYMKVEVSPDRISLSPVIHQGHTFYVGSTTINVTTTTQTPVGFYLIVFSIYYPSSTLYRPQKQVVFGVVQTFKDIPPHFLPGPLYQLLATKYMRVTSFSSDSARFSFTTTLPNSATVDLFPTTVALVPGRLNGKMVHIGYLRVSVASSFTTPKGTYLLRLTTYFSKGISTTVVYIIQIDTLRRVTITQPVVAQSAQSPMRIPGTRSV